MSLPERHTQLNGKSGIPRTTMKSNIDSNKSDGRPASRIPVAGSNIPASAAGNAVAAPARLSLVPRPSSARGINRVRATAPPQLSSTAGARTNSSKLRSPSTARPAGIRSTLAHSAMVNSAAAKFSAPRGTAKQSTMLKKQELVKTPLLPRFNTNHVNIVSLSPISALPAEHLQHGMITQDSSFTIDTPVKAVSLFSKDSLAIPNSPLMPSLQMGNLSLSPLPAGPAHEHQHEFITQDTSFGDTEDDSSSMSDFETELDLAALEIVKSEIYQNDITPRDLEVGDLQVDSGLALSNEDKPESGTHEAEDVSADPAMELPKSPKKLLVLELVRRMNCKTKKRCGINIRYITYKEKRKSL